MPAAGSPAGLANDAAARPQTIMIHRFPSQSAALRRRRRPEAFLAQFRTQACLLEIPPQLLPRPLIAKLTGDAFKLTWFNLRFAGQDTTVTLEEIALALVRN